MCRELNLELLSQIDRSQIHSILQIAHYQLDKQRTNPEAELTDEDSVQNQVVNLMWSDPSNDFGTSFNTARGGGMYVHGAEL